MMDTPRTDAAMELVIANGEVLSEGYMPLWVVSRQLERELAMVLDILGSAARSLDKAGLNFQAEIARAAIEVAEAPK